MGDWPAGTDGASVGSISRPPRVVAVTTSHDDRGVGALRSHARRESSTGGGPERSTGGGPGSLDDHRWWDDWRGWIRTFDLLIQNLLIGIRLASRDLSVRQTSVGRRIGVSQVLIPK